MKKKILQRIMAMGLVLTLTVGMSMQATAATAGKAVNDDTAQALQEAQKEKEALQKELEAAQQTIRELKESKGNVEDKVAALNKQLIRSRRGSQNWKTSLWRRARISCRHRRI